MQNLQDDDEHVIIVYEDALRRATPPTAAVPTLRRRRAVQLQGEQQQEEELLRHASPSRDNGGAEQQAERSPKRRSGTIPSQLWADASQLQPPGSPPAAPEHHPSLTLADLKAEMQASSAAKRGPQQTPRSRQVKQSVRRRASVASPAPHSSGRRRQQTPRNALRTPRRAGSGTPGPVLSMSATLSMLRSQTASERPSAQEAQLAEAISSGEEDGAATAVPAVARHCQAGRGQPSQAVEAAQPGVVGTPQARGAAEQHCLPGSAATSRSAHAFIAAHAAATTPHTPRRAQAASQSLSSRLQHLLQTQPQAHRSTGAQLSLRIMARRMEGHAIIARVDCVAGANTLAGDGDSDSTSPVFAVFDSKSGMELDVGCTVSMQPPLYTVTLPSGSRVVLCPNDGKS